MPVLASNINYATPTYSNIMVEGYDDTVKYFSFHNNILDGTFHPLAASGPLWGSALSDASGVLSTPLVITVTDTNTVHALRLKGDTACAVYPTEFTITLYNGATPLFSQTFTNNSVAWIHYLSQVYNATSYVVSITKINKPNSVARIVSVFNPHELHRSSSAVVKTSESSILSQLLYKAGVDSLVVRLTEAPAFTNKVAAASNAPIILTENRSFTNSVRVNNSLPIILTDNDTIHNDILSDDTLIIAVSEYNSINNTVRSTDTLLISSDNTQDFTCDILANDALNVFVEDIPTLTNVHTRMKEMVRSIYGMTRITYMNPLLDGNLVVTSNGEAYNGEAAQVLDNIKDSKDVFFTLYDNVLNGTYNLLGEDNTAGWVSPELSQVYCGFETDPELTVSFTPRLMQKLTIRSSRVMDIMLIDFTVNVLSNGTVHTYNIIGNDSYDYVLNGAPLPEVTQVQVVVHTINKQFAPANITELTLSAVVTYGQQDLISMDFLEEISYDDDFESLGGLSANTATINLRNDEGQFYFNTENSLVANQLKKNRKIEPFLGTEIIPGEIEWYPLGTFWSYSWDVPVGQLYAKVVAFDTLGLLNTFMYTNRTTLVNKSLGYAIDIILTDAKNTQYPLLEWEVDDTLYNVVIPYMWFTSGSYMQALNRLAMCYRMNIYCDRFGKVLARVRKTYTSHYDTWSDKTNVMDKTYPTLNTESPNTVEVITSSVSAQNASVIDIPDLMLTISAPYVLTFNSSEPIVDNVLVTITKDETVGYTCEVFSWGIKFYFTGTGLVSSISVTADKLTIKEGISITVSDDVDVALNGKRSKIITSEFIQTIQHATSLATVILDDILLDKYDVDVNYTGNIALSIDAPIKLEDGIAPIDTYRLTRNELYWDGALYGTAKLNT